MIEAYVAEKEQIQRAVHDEAGVTAWSSGQGPPYVQSEVQRQKDEEAHFAAELQSLREQGPQASIREHFHDSGKRVSATGRRAGTFRRILFR